MPIQISNSVFTDVFGNQTSQFVSNSGDELTVKLTLRSVIRNTSINNPLTLDPIVNQITSSVVNWENEGFRVGDWCVFFRRSSTGTNISSFFSKIEYIDGSIAEFSNVNDFYNISDLETMEIIALDFFDDPVAPTPPSSGFLPRRPRATLNVLLNQCLNSVNGQPNSLIDGEQTRFIFENVESMDVSDVINGISIPNRSGNFVKECKLTRISDNSNGWLQYELECVFVNSGIYESQWFFTNECLKLFAGLQWQSIPNDGLNPATTFFDEIANTGWFNQSHNVSPSNSVLVSSTTGIDYLVPTNHVVSVDGPIVDIGIGACYISTNDSYYKNRTFDQNEITMIVPTSDVDGLPTLVSEQNEFGAGYSIEVTNVSVSGTQTTISFTFTPNADFGLFMSNVDDGDRLFYVWLKCGNINHLVFADQLKTDPPIAGPLNMESDFGFLDHSQNVDEIFGNQTGFEANTEDDIAYFGTFLLEKNESVERLVVSVEAFNNVNSDSFTLSQTVFDFGPVPISNDGRYLLNQQSQVVSTLPINSEKLFSKLKLRPDLDVGNEYGVQIYFPFLLRWEYWLEQLNANIDFWPNQNKNWQQYNVPVEWQLQLKLSLVKNGLAFNHTNVFVNKNYDSEKNIIQNIELFIDSTNQNVGIVTENELMRVVATHELTSGVWNPFRTWGMITVEPKESTPRSICSSILPFDNNQQNPLVPLNGVQMVITYPQPNVARMECFFDPEKINLSNGVKFTSKIKQKCDDLSKITKITSDGLIKSTSDNIDKIIS
jgi:hypothetical protein